MSAARLALPRPIGFVLGGGASLGAVQVGMLRALAEAGVRPDLVAGTSVGAINGAAVAEDPAGAAARLARLWSATERDAVFPGSLLSQLRTLHTSRTHLFDNDGLGDMIGGALSSTRFDGLALPLGVVTLDTTNGRPLLVTRGELRPALLASSAIPGIFGPVEIDGRPCLDGGVVALVPVLQALAMGAASLVVLDCGVPGLDDEPPDDLVHILLFTWAILLRRQVDLELPLAAERVPVVYLPVPFPMTVSPVDFGHGEELASRAYEASRLFLAALHVDGPGLYGEPPEQGGGEA